MHCLHPVVSLSVCPSSLGHSQAVARNVQDSTHDSDNEVHPHAETSLLLAWSLGYNDHA